MSKEKKNRSGKNTARVPIWGYAIGCGIPLVIVGLGVLLAQARYAENQATESVLGAVVAFDETISQRDSEGRGGISYRPVVEYAVGDKKYRCTGGTYSGTNYWAIGDQLTVRYWPHDPADAFIDTFFSRWLGPVALMLAGGYFLFFLWVGSFASGTTPSKDPRTWWWQFAAGQVFCFGFLGPGLAMIIAAYAQGMDTESVIGTVVGNREWSVSGAKYYRPIVEYQVDGKSYICQHLEWSDSKRVIDSKMTIHYRANYPEGVINTSETNLYCGGVFLLASGMVPEIGALLFLLRRNKAEGKRP